MRSGGAVTLRVMALAAVLAGCGASGLLLARPGSLAPLTVLPWWIFAGLFAVTEACDIRLRVRGQIHSVSVSEVPLVMGLFLAAPHDLLIGRVLGSGLIFVLYRRQTWVKSTFNVALVAAGTAAALWVFHLLTGGLADPLGLRSTLAAVLAAALLGLLDTVALLTVTHWYNSELSVPEVLRSIAFSPLLPAVVGLIGVVPVLAFSQGQAALPLAALGAAGLLGYRAFAALSDRHASLARLYELSDALAAAPASSDVVASVLHQSSDLLRAAYAEVMLAGDDGGEALWSLRSGERVSGPVAVPAGALSPPVPAGASAEIGGRGAPPQELAFLAGRGISHAAVAPLRNGDSLAGYLLVADRLGEDRGFQPADVRLLETVANHASLALRNGRLIDRLHFEARHDELTGLPNRLYFRHLLDRTGEAVAAGASCAVMVMDFNGFKAINDTLGHAAGDELLRELAGRFAVLAADQATVARLGGDEFAVIMRGPVDVGAAVALAERLMTGFDEPVLLGETRLRVGGSLGVAVAPEHGRDASDLLRHADVAMYAAKAGSGGVRLYSPELAEPERNPLTLATDLREALARDEIGIALQPVIYLTTGALHSVEVLARWHHPTLGEIPPAEFFAAAERSGQVGLLSQRILDRALALCREWHESGRSVRVSVNLAPRWLADPSLPEQIGQALARHGVPADLLALEIVEYSVIADPRGATRALGRLRDMGVHLSLDDFGTGYSSLTYLSRLPVEQVKLDREFVDRLHSGPRDRAIVKSLLDLGRNLGLEVVAEGVTEAGIRRALQEMGCTLAQGYLFAEPVTPELVPRLVDQFGIVPAAGGGDTKPPWPRWRTTGTEAEDNS